MLKRKRGQCCETSKQCRVSVKSFSSTPTPPHPQNLDLFKCMSCLSLTRANLLKPAVVSPLLGLGVGVLGNKGGEGNGEYSPKPTACHLKGREAQAIDFFFLIQIWQISHDPLHSSGWLRCSLHDLFRIRSIFSCI